MVATKGWGGEEMKEILFKGTHLQLVDKSWSSNTQHSEYRQQNCIINIAKRLHFNCSQQKNLYVTL